MTVTAAKLRAVVTADTSAGSKGLADFGRQVSATRATANRDLAALGGAFKDLSSLVAPLGIAFSAGALLSFGRDAAMVASDVTEAYNKVDVVFGAVADSVVQFARDSTTDLGMSRREAYAALGTFGNLFTSMGVGREQAAHMSTSLTQLAADLGSFNNIDPTIALDKLRAGIVGEAEPLRALGINLTAAATQAKAVELGLAQAGGTMSTAAAVAARYALIMEQSTNAQGDFARTAENLANSSRIAAKEIDDLKANLGKLVEKPYTAVVHVVAQAVGGLNEMLETGPAKKALEDYTAAVQVLTAAEADLSKARTSWVYALTRDASVAHYEEQVAAAEAAVAAAYAQYEQQLLLNDVTLQAEDAERAYTRQMRETVPAAYAAAAAMDELAVRRARLAAVERGAGGGLLGELSMGDRTTRPATPVAGSKAYNDKLAAEKALAAYQRELGKTTNTRIVDDYQRQMQSALRDLASEYRNAFSQAQQFSIGLSDLRPGGAQGPNAPGQNGAFEDIYRLQAFVQSGSWGETAAKYGLDQAGAADVVRKFQTGIWDQAVLQIVDKAKLVEQIQQAQLGQAMMDALAADLAQASNADPQLIKTMLGLGSGSGAVKLDFGGQLVPAMIRAMDAELVTSGKNLEAEGAKAYDLVGKGFVRRASESPIFARAINAMVDESLKRYIPTNQ